MESSNSSNRFSVLSDEHTVHNDSVEQPAKIPVNTLKRQSVVRAHYEMIDQKRKLYMDLDEVFCKGTQIVNSESIDFSGYNPVVSITDDVKIEVDYSHPKTQVVKKEKKPYKARAYSDSELAALEAMIAEVKSKTEELRHDPLLNQLYPTAMSEHEMKEFMQDLEISLQAETMFSEDVTTQSGDETENEGIFLDAIDVEDRADRLFRSPCSEDDDGSYFSSADDSDEDMRSRFISFMDEFKQTIGEQCKNFSNTDYKLAERIEAIFWFIVYDWPKSSSKKELMAMVGRLVSRLLGLKTVADAGRWLVELFSTSVAPQSGDESIRFDQKWLTSVAAKFVSSELYEKIVKFSCALMTLAVSGTTKVALTGSLYEKVWAASKIVVKKGDIVTTVLNFLAWLLKSGYKVLTGELSLEDFFTKSSDVQLFDMRVAKLDYWKSELEAGREEECTMVSFGIEVTTLSQFAAMLNRTATKQVRLTLANQIRRIDAHWSWFRTKENEKPLRKSPFAILFEGGTSVAKSSMLPYITTMLQHKLGLKVGPEFSYDFNPSDAYMSGFSNMINTIVMDDIGNTQPLFADKASSQTIIDIINNNKKVAVMADLESKGQYLIKPEIVLGTTNVEQLNAGQTSNCAISILRRWTYCIKVVMKPEFAGPGGIRRDDVNPDMERMDVWNLTLYRWVPKEDNSDPVKEIIMSDASFETVCRFLLTAATDHNQKQANMVHVTTHLKSVPICECGLMDFVCKLHYPLDPRIERAEIADGAYTINRVVPNAGYEWSPGHALNEVFHSKSHKAGLDYLRSQYNRYVRESALFIRFMCTLQVLRTDAQRNSLWCFLMYISFNITLMIMYFKAIIFASCGLVIIPAANIVMCTVCTIAYAVSIFRRPLCETLKEAIAVTLTKQNGRRAAKLAALIGTIAALYQARKMWIRHKIKPQGGAVSKTGSEKGRLKKLLEAQAQGVSDVRDIYREQFIRPMPINIDTKTASCAQICEVLQSKLLYARFLKDRDINGTATQCVVIPICSEFLLVPWHVVRNDDKKYIQIMARDTNHTNASRFFGIENQWRHVPGTDFALLRSATVGSQKNIISWFPEGSVLDDLRNVMNTSRIGCRLLWLKGVRDRSKPGLNISLSQGVEFVSAACGEVYVYSTPNLRYWGGTYMSVVPTYDGMCGSPLVTDRSSGPMILGLHSAGATSTTNARFCSVGQKDLEDTMKSFLCDIVPNSIMHEEGDHVDALRFKGTNFEYTTKQAPHATSPYVAGQYDILGYTKEPKRNFKSNVHITMWSEELEQMGMPRKHEAPALMNSYVPWNMWLNNTSKPSCIDPVCLSLARDDYLQKLQQGIQGDVLAELKSLAKPLAHEVVLAGLDGIKGIDAINRKTSMGIPWCRPKNEYIKPIDIEYPGISVPLGCDRAIMEEIAKMEAKLKEGYRVYVAHRCNLKDEAVKLNKLKVRVFLGSPFPYLFLMRKYFLGLSAFIQRHPYLFETAVGINCYGPEWAKLRDHLIQYGSNKMFAGDYKAFDQKMEIGITKASFEVLLMLCQMAGYSDEDMTVCRGLMTETIEGVYDLKGEWIRLLGANPSGHSLTVVINGIGNAIQMRCPYYALAPQIPPLYHTKVALVTYGDDNVGGVSEDIPWYNHSTISEKFAEWGITYTMADKEGQSVPYINIDECSFLKRTWVYNAERQTYDAPLEHDSILKTLHTFVASKVIDIKEQHAELLLSANREYFMYGCDVFETKRQLLTDLAEKYEVSHFMPNARLPTREELEEWVLEGY